MLTVADEEGGAVSGVMPGPANPALQGAAQNGGRHIGKFKNDFMLQLCFHAKSL